MGRASLALPAPYPEGRQPRPLSPQELSLTLSPVSGAGTRTTDPVFRKHDAPFIAPLDSCTSPRNFSSFIDRLANVYIEKGLASLKSTILFAKILSKVFAW